MNSDSLLWVYFNSENNIQSDWLTTEDMHFELIKFKKNELEPLVLKSNTDQIWISAIELIQQPDSVFSNLKRYLESTPDFSTQNINRSESNADALFTQVYHKNLEFKKDAVVGYHQFDGDQLSDNDLVPKPVQVSFGGLHLGAKPASFKLEVLLFSRKGTIVKSFIEQAYPNGIVIDTSLNKDFDNHKFEVLVTDKLKNQKYKFLAHLFISESSQFIEFIFTNPQQKNSFMSLLIDYKIRSNEIMKGAA